MKSCSLVVVVCMALVVIMGSMQASAAKHFDVVDCRLRLLAVNLGRNVLASTSTGEDEDAENDVNENQGNYGQGSAPADSSSDGNTHHVFPCENLNQCAGGGRKN